MPLFPGSDICDLSSTTQEKLDQRDLVEKTSTREWSDQNDLGQMGGKREMRESPFDTEVAGRTVSKSRNRTITVRRLQPGTETFSRLPAPLG